jgi:hypothetical protein
MRIHKFLKLFYISVENLSIFLSKNIGPKITLTGEPGKKDLKPFFFLIKIACFLPNAYILHYENETLFRVVLQLEKESRSKSSIFYRVKKTFFIVILLILTCKNVILIIFRINLSKKTY